MRLGFKLILLLNVCCFNVHLSTAQSLFIFPIDTPLSISGTFGELRANHYHSGLDFKTEGKEGRRVFAAATGWVSRIKMSAVGFGNVIYMDHSTGYTTVYAHLHHFNANLMSYLDSAQYASESFEMELFPDSGRFSFEQGEMIGVSGNTGGSQGPHLHFEIRNKESQIPTNPLMYLPALTDTIAPIIGAVCAFSKQYPFRYFSLSDSSSRQPVLFTMGSDTLYLGVLSEDPSGENRLGVYELQLFQEDSLIYSIKYDEFRFDETKYVNAHVHPTGAEGKGGMAHLLFKLPGDLFSVYKNAGSGAITKPLNDTLHLRINSKDFAGNASEVSILIQPTQKRKSAKQKPARKVMPYDQKNEQEGENGIKVIIPLGALYQDVPLTPIRIIKSNLYSFGLFSVLDSLKTPLHKSASIQIPFQPISGIPIEKHVLIRVNCIGQPIEEYISPDTILQNMLIGKIRKAGCYSIGVDTVSPGIDSILLVTDTIDHQSYFASKISDSQTGIKSYQVLENGKWKLASFDFKTGILRWKISETLPFKARYQLRVVDFCNNVSTLDWEEQ